MLVAQASPRFLCVPLHALCFRQRELLCAFPVRAIMHSCDGNDFERLLVCS